jgi:hypothetical protein
MYCEGDGTGVPVPYKNSPLLWRGVGGEVESNLPLSVAHKFFQSLNKYDETIFLLYFSISKKSSAAY